MPPYCHNCCLGTTPKVKIRIPTNIRSPCAAAPFPPVAKIVRDKCQNATRQRWRASDGLLAYFRTRVFCGESQAKSIKSRPPSHSWLCLRGCDIKLCVGLPGATSGRHDSGRRPKGLVLETLPSERVGEFYEEATRGRSASLTLRRYFAMIISLSFDGATVRIPDGQWPHLRVRTIASPTNL